MANLFVITARSGSVGVKNKNILTLSGIPLIGFKAISARKSDYCDKLIISTDSEEYAETGKRYGAEAPFIRPDELSTSAASSIDVLLHAMNWAEENCFETFDTITLLEPSSPFSTYEDINKAFALYEKKNALGVLAVKKSINSVFVAPLGEDLSMLNHYEKISAFHDLRRQALRQEYTMNGALYIADWSYLKKHKTFHSDRTYAYVMNDNYSLEIDEEIDYHYAKFLIEHNFIDIQYWKHE